LSVVVDTLEAALSDTKEFVVLLGGCPRLNQQPYNTYLYMERCMFGRQMEKEHIISFLLQPAQDLEVLPVIGPHEVGKRTLVEHVWLEERVRNHFAKIHRLCSDDLDVQSQGLIDTPERSLLVIDLTSGDKDKERCRGFLSSVRRGAHGESRRHLRAAGRAAKPPLAARHSPLWVLLSSSFGRRSGVATCSSPLRGGTLRLPG
ncbi:unnamed protein product, partial [Urochloa humidicola]